MVVFITCTNLFEFNKIWGLDPPNPHFCWNNWDATIKKGLLFSRFYETIMVPSIISIKPLFFEEKVKANIFPAF